MTLFVQIVDNRTNCSGAYQSEISLLLGVETTRNDRRGVLVNSGNVSNTIQDLLDVSQ